MGHKARTIETGNHDIQEIRITERSPQGGVINPADLFGKGAGRLTTPLELTASWASDPVFDRYLNLLNGRGNTQHSAAEIREQISRDLHYNNNDATIRFKDHGRAASAFYTIDEAEGTLTVEWGKIDPTTQEGKLHDSLRGIVDYYDRVRKGMKVVSGHIAPIHGSGRFFAIIDSFHHSSHSPQQFTETEFKLIDSLHSYGFLPLTTQGRLLGTSISL